MDSVLAVDDLSISFEVDGVVRPAVRGVTFSVARGQVVALVGESGSGKSVTAMAALGLLPGTARVSGSISLDGTSLVGAPAATLRSVRGGRIGTVFQEPMTAFNPVFTVGNQIGEAIRVHRSLGRSAVRDRVRELLGVVGLSDVSRVAGSYPHELSGGQLQRAMIAMAISCDPVLLIADEPTTALDVTVQAGILDLLRDLRERLGMAILLITHDMGVVADLADEAVVLREGVLVEKAPVARLFSAPADDYTKELLGAVPSLAALASAGSGPTVVPSASSSLATASAPSASSESSASSPAELVPSASSSSAAVPSASSATERVPSSVVASLEDVVVEYPGRRRVRALDGVTLSIGRGEIVGLVGESGSGKSTAGRVLAGLVPAKSGDVQIDGTELPRGGRALRTVRSKMGIVFQDPASSLNPRLTVGDSIGEPLVLHGSFSDTRVAELLDAVQLPVAFARRYPYEMSGGQRQRVGLARALALNPDLLIADEPTSALDVSVQARILELLRDLQRRFGFGCLFISHDLAVVRQLAHRVAVMHEGRIVEQGPSESVLTAPADPYTRRLLAAAPVADPVLQASRRAARRELAHAAPDPE